ncbi:Hint domain-containing protein [Celeribacter halophilus]|uniref:Hint domain-containing protein n=1 Tax=Celeribacter halophilus TaxID=576117 RepID=UPI003A95A019
MSVYDLELYDFDPEDLFGTSSSTTVTYSGGGPSGTASVTDSDGTLKDDDLKNNSETATADVTINGVTSSGSSVDANAVWTVTDQDTGESFEIVQFVVDSGSAAGTYTLSEQPLIDGHEYEVTDYNGKPGRTGNNPSEAFTYDDYVDSSSLADGIVSGSEGDDTIDSSYTSDDDGDMVDHKEYTVESTLSWEDLGEDGSSLEDGASTVINGVQVDVSYTENNTNNTATISDETIYTENDDFSDNSSLELYGSGDSGEASKISIDFSSTDSSTISDEVENVTFRISDIDYYSFVDTVTITATDADGNDVSLTITPEGNVDVSGNEITGTSVAYYERGRNEYYLEADDENGAVLVTIPGPVSNVTITYGNDGTEQQAIYISDIQFDAVYSDYDDTVEAGDGDDTIASGLGDDIVYGGAGDDTIDGGAGDDTLYGEEGDDTFIGGDGADSMSGGSGQDTIDYSGSDEAVSIDLSTGSYSGGDAEGDSGSGIDGIIGSDFNDTLIGFDSEGTGDDAFTNQFWGGDGDDYIDGAGGDDELYGEAGNDTIYGGAGADNIDGGTGDDTIYAGGGDTVTGGEGSDTIIIDPSLLDGNAITITGSEDDDGEDNDVLDLSNVGLDWSSNPISYNEDDPESGTVTLTDGTTISFSGIETVICFGKGTRIATPYGARAVEDFKPGDLVLTMDNGLQPLRWVGARTVPATGRFAPIEITKGALGNERDLIVSPQHRMLLNGWRSEMLFNTSEVFAAAKHLVNGSTIREAQGGFVTYYHLMFDRHEVIFAEGAASESFHVSDYSLTGVADGAREELFALFPELRSMPDQHGSTARQCLKAHEVQLLVA